MRRSIFWPAVIALACLGFAGAPAIADDSGRATASPGDAAAVVPEDVHLLLQITGAADIRRELADRPIARWLAAMVKSSEFDHAWTQLARDTGHSSAALFDQCFGRRVTVLYRRAGNGHEHDAWALITEMSADDSTDLLRRLEPRTLRSRHRFSLYELPEHDLLLARRNEIILIGPRQQPALVMDVLNRHGEGGANMRSLREADDFAAIRELSSGNIALFIRHERPLGGYSAAVLQLDEDRARLQHRARFDSPPFARDITRIEIDASPLNALEDHALVAMIEPTDIGTGPLETFLMAALGESLLSPTLRENLGDRRIIVLGDIEGRQEEEPVDLLAPTIAIALDLNNTDGARDEVDQQVTKFVRRLAERGGDRFTIDVPEADAFDESSAREVDISPATQWFTGSLPIAKPMTLNWSVLEESDCGFVVFATHPDELRDTLDALRSEKHGAAEEQGRGWINQTALGRFQSCGLINGVRISHHLESWAERPDLFHGTDGQAEEEFTHTLRIAARLAAGIDRLQWRLIRPSRNEMQLDVRLLLAPPSSARPE